MEHYIGLKNRHGAVGHLERRIILTVAVERIMVTKTDTEHIRYFENVSLAVELLQVHRKLERETVCTTRGCRELSLRSLRGKGALHGL